MNLYIYSITMKMLNIFDMYSMFYAHFPVTMPIFSRHSFTHIIGHTMALMDLFQCD